MLETVVLIGVAAVATPLWLTAFWIRGQGRPVVQHWSSEEAARTLDGAAAARRPAGAPRRQTGAPRRRTGARPPHLRRRAGRPGQLTGRLTRTRRRSLALPDTVAAARAVPNDPHLAGAFPWPEPMPPSSPARAVRPPVAERPVANPDRVTVGAPPAGPQIDLTDTGRPAPVTYTAVTAGPAAVQAPPAAALQAPPAAALQAPPAAALQAPAPALQRAPVDGVLERAGSRAVVDTSEIGRRRAGRHAVPEPAPVPAEAAGYPSISAILPDPRQGRRRA